MITETREQLSESNLNQAAGGVVVHEVNVRDNDGNTYGPYFVIDNDTGKPVTGPDGKRIDFSDEVDANTFDTGYHAGKEALKNQLGMMGNGR